MDVSDEIYSKRKENPKTLSGKFLWWFEKYVHNLKHFILRNKTFVDNFFVILYLFEQIIFLYLILSPKSKYEPQIIAAVFIIILLFTMAIEKSLMELRFITLNRTIALLQQKNLIMKSKAKESINLISKTNTKKD